MDLVDIFKSLGDENRLRIVNILLYGEFCVCEIEQILKLTQSNASRHLNRLKMSGIIESRKRAQWIHYKINPKFVKENDLLLNYIKQKLAEDEKFKSDIEKIKNILEKG